MRPTLFFLNRSEAKFWTFQQKRNIARISLEENGAVKSSMSTVSPLRRTYLGPATAERLDKVLVKKPWGRTELSSSHGPRGTGRVGEIWFTGGEDQRLLPKYLFTSEKLSIQVHPETRSSSLWPGKTECWYILEAGPNSTIAVGLKSPVSREDLRAAALDGSIEEMLDWRPVKRGDVFVVPPGIIHSVGSDITLLEIGQNSDVTYRLYDYGRPRQLHVEEAVASAHTAPCADNLCQHAEGDEIRILLNSSDLTVVYTHSDCLHERGRWVLPLNAQIRSGSVTAGPGECLYLPPGAMIDEGDANMVIAA